MNIYQNIMIKGNWDGWISHQAYDDGTNGDIETDELYLERGEIRDGGAAMVAYAKMQFTQMSGQERQNIIKALLRYCEMDTLAMVMIYEHWLSCRDQQ